MGLYERDYGRSQDSTPWDRVQNQRSITVTLVIINVVIFFADLLFSQVGDRGVRESWLAPWCAASSETITKPWMWWQFLTYGFVHSTADIRHLLFNMIGLFVFGRSVEQRLGRMEYLRVYLAMVVLGGIIGSLQHFVGNLISGQQIVVQTIGASGGVVGMAVLFACYFPNRELLLMLVFPVKAWVLATFFVLMDIAGAVSSAFGSSFWHSNTAFTVHLVGAFFGLLYYFRRWDLKWLDLAGIANLPARMRQRSRRMRLKLHDPDRKIEQEAAEADRILAKIHESGQDSLTAAERKTLERYSRRQREKREV